MVERLQPSDIDETAAARGALYQTLVELFDEPDEALYESMTDGTLHEDVATLLDEAELAVTAPPLTTDDDHELVCARYNDIFEVGVTAATDRANGDVDREGPPVPLYENCYRSAVSWTDLNVDLARAYEYFGVGIDQERREHHDHLGLELEFAGYLARREATGEEDAAAARRDFLDRHLSVFAEGIAERLDDEPGTGVFGDAGTLLVDVVTADLRDLEERREATETVETADGSAGGDSA